MMNVYCQKRLTPWASIQFESHRNMRPPTTRIESDIPTVDWWINRVGLQGILVSISCECLKKNSGTLEEQPRTERTRNEIRRTQGCSNPAKITSRDAN